MAQRRHWGARGIVSLLIFIIAALSTPIALVGNWGHRTVTDSATYIETVGPLAADPAIQQAVAAKVTEAITAEIDTTGLVGGFLDNFIKSPDLNDKLSAPIAAGINSLIGNLVLKFVQSDAFQTVWIDVNTAAQKSLVAILNGGNEGPIQVNGDAIVLDVTSLLTVIQQKLVADGATILENVPIPDNGKQVVLFESPMIGAAQTIYKLSAPILMYYPLFVALLFALSIALARNRPRTVLATGIALAVSALVLRFSMTSLHDLVTSQYRGSLFDAAFDAFWNQFFANLITGIMALLLLGIVIGVAGWYAGRSRPATRIREEVCTGLHQLSVGAPRGLNDWVRRYGAVLRWAVGVVFILVLVLAGSLTPERVFWLSALAAGLFTLIELFNAPDREVVVEEFVVVEGV